VFLWRLFFTNPLMACALCVCLGQLQHTGVISIILRISALERKSTEVRLRLVEANDRPRAGGFVSLDQHDQSVSEIILRSNPLATIGLDRAGTVIYWNSAAERLLGWKSDEVVGKPGPQLRVECWVSDILDSSGRPCGTVHILRF
jgi:PAS domain-containing protein